MQVALLIVAFLASVDLLVCGVVLVVAWGEYRRIRRTAIAAGHPDLPPATREFLMLAVLGLVGVGVLYGSIWLLIRR